MKNIPFNEKTFARYEENFGVKFTHKIMWIIKYLYCCKVFFFSPNWIAQKFKLIPLAIINNYLLNIYIYIYIGSCRLMHYMCIKSEHIKKNRGLTQMS